MKRTAWLLVSAIAMFAIASSAMAANTIAITEFLNNAEGEDSGREWVELFNYGADPVDLAGWTLTDEDSDSVSLPSIVMPSGGYIVLVNGASDLTAAQSKAVFEQEWFGGIANPNVFGVTGMALGNSDDELIVKDAGDVIVWNVAYNDAEGDHSTWLTMDDFSRTDWGQKGGPVINRQGDDLGITGLIGYERNIETLDPLAWESDYLAIKDSGFLTGQGIDTLFFDNVDNGSFGSPLTGQYTVVPEPACIALMALGAMSALRRRR